MDFRDYFSGQNAMPGLNPYPSMGGHLYGLGPHSSLLYPLGMSNSYGGSQFDYMAKTAAESRTSELQRRLLAIDPRLAQVRRNFGISPGGVIPEIVAGAINSSYARGYTGGDIRDIGSAAMLLASRGMRGLDGSMNFSGGVLQQRFASDIATTLVGGMTESATYNGLSVGRTAELAANLFSIKGSDFAGMSLSVGKDGKVGMSPADKKMLEDMMKSSGELVKDLEDIFGGESINKLFERARRLTGKLVSSDQNAKEIASTLSGITNAAQAYGVDERALIELASRPSQYALAAGYSPEVALLVSSTAATSAASMSRLASAGGLAVTEAGQQSVEEQNRTKVLGDIVSRAKIYAAGALGSATGAERERLIEIAENVNADNVSTMLQEISSIVGVDLQAMDQTRAGRNHLLNTYASTREGRMMLSEASDDMYEKTEGRKLRRADAEKFVNRSDQFKDSYAEVMGLVNRNTILDLAATHQAGKKGVAQREGVLDRLRRGGMSEEQLQTIDNFAFRIAADGPDGVASFENQLDLISQGSPHYVSNVENKNEERRTKKDIALFGSTRNFFNQADADNILSSVLRGIGSKDAVTLDRTGAMSLAIRQRQLLAADKGVREFADDSDEMAKLEAELRIFHPKKQRNSDGKMVASWEQEALDRIFQDESLDGEEKLIALRKEGLVEFFESKDESGNKVSSFTMAGTLDFAESMVGESLGFGKEDADLLREHFDLSSRSLPDYSGLPGADAPGATEKPFDLAEERLEFLRSAAVIEGGTSRLEDLWSGGNMDKLSTPALNSLLSVLRSKEAGRMNIQGLGEVTEEMEGMLTDRRARGDSGEHVTNLGIVKFRDEHGTNVTLTPITED